MTKHSLFVIIASVFWGSIGIFSRYLSALGLSSSDVIILRCGLAAIFFAITILLKNPSEFKIKLKDIWCFIGTGIFSLLFFTYCYFEAIERMSLSVAAILLYTAPSIVSVISVYTFKEKFTKRKFLALILSFSGCCFVSGLFTGLNNINFIGVLFGLGSGFGYALYSIFARFALDRSYSSATINLYSCLFAAIGASIIWGSDMAVAVLVSSVPNFLVCLALGFFTCYLAYLLYTIGLSGMEAGRASVMASLEPVVATVFGVVLFKEALTVYSIVGIVLVLSAIIVLNEKA